MPRADGVPAAVKGRLIFRLRLWTTVAAVPALAVLIGLGVWQLQRLAWKETLIATLEERTAAAAVALPAAADLARADLDDLEFRRVRVSGALQHAAAMPLLNRTFDGRVGVHVITPLVRPDGGVVLIDLGWAPPDYEAPATPEQIVVEGFVRLFRPPGPFVPDNEPERGQWYAMDAADMAAPAGVAAVAPVYVTLAPAAAMEGYPRAEMPAVNLRNDHLQYAITWFALAAGLIGVFVVFHTRRVDV